MDFIDTIVVRVPQKKYPGISSPSDLDDYIGDIEFLNALLVANPELYQMVISYKGGSITDAKKVEKLKKALGNYFKRSSTDPTPFGLFTGIGHGTWSSTFSNSEFDPMSRSIKASLDAEVLNLIFEKIGNQNGTIESIRYYPNNTLYLHGEKFRYYERTLEGVQTVYRLSSVENSVVLNEILNITQKGLTLLEIIKATILNQYPVADALDFLKSIVKEQILVSELNLVLSGRENLENAINILEKISAKNSQPEESLLFLKDLRAALIDLEKCKITDFQSGYKRLKYLLDQNNINVRKVFLKAESFLKIPFNLPSDIQLSLKRAMSLLSTINHQFYIPSLEITKKKFTEKFDSQFVPLLTMFDPECGIQQEETAQQIENVLLSKDILGLLNKDTPNTIGHSEETLEIIRKKIWLAWNEKHYVVELKTADFSAHKDHLHKLCPTGQVVFTIDDIDKKLISLITIGNSSGGNLISRFASDSDQISNGLSNLGEFESGFYEDCLVAEVIHLPNTRMANISFRPIFRKYEIPIYTRSGLEEDNVIGLDDIIVTLIYGQFILFSKKHKKRIIPYITNAHNYNKNTISLFQFLGDVQFQNSIPSLQLKMNFAFAKFVPRIQYENVILQKATWRLNSSDLTKVSSNISTKEHLAVKEKWQMPEVLEFVIGSNKGLLIWSDSSSVSSFRQTVKENPQEPILLTEVTFNAKSSWIKDKHGNAYYNECIALYRNTAKSFSSQHTNFLESYVASLEDFKVQYRPGDNWLFLKLYYNIPIGEKLLRGPLLELINNLYRERKIVRFFFLWYKDPEYHLRLRFKLSNGVDQFQILKRVRDVYKSFEESNSIWDVKVDTYKRESIRYGMSAIKSAEIFFEIDSLFVLNLNRIINNVTGEGLPFMAIKNVDALLDGFEYTLQDKFNIIRQIRNVYESEFKVKEKAALRRAMDIIEQKNRVLVEEIMNETPGALAKIVDEKGYYLLISNYKSSIRKFSQKFKRKQHNSDKLELILNSLIHMHFIRFFPFKPRENELLIYTLLFNFYKKRLYKEKITSEANLVSETT